MTSNEEKNKELKAEGREFSMVEGIIEGSPDAIGVAVIRLNCGCRKMAAINAQGDPASEIITYRDGAESVCYQCKKDNGAFERVTEQFIHWIEPEPSQEKKNEIIGKVLGT